MDNDIPDQENPPRRQSGRPALDRAAAGDLFGEKDDWIRELVRGGEPEGANADSGEEGTAPDGDALSRGPAEPETEADPTCIGRYQVVRALGQGAFGRVYLARDADLRRQVAIKVPLHRDGRTLVDLELYLNEARILARLSHPNIVPVHDVGHTDDGRGFVVSMFVSGGDLAARLKAGRPAFLESARLAAAICDAMHYAHTRDLFHRDIKPANILIDENGVPYLADFGLAMKDEDYGKGPRFAGTVAYTSPEQARSEGHLVDGRSDIFSMGVVFYEMLTGRRPFRGESAPQILRQIISSEPRPPRQIDDAIPRELERICLRAIAKRASERYSTARDMAEDLRQYLEVRAKGIGTEVPLPAAALAPVAATTEQASLGSPRSGHSDLASKSIRVVPKGLCSFDEHDADFFLELLPGPRDREGLPDGLRFWKARIEAAPEEKTFRVGLVYGPSGCGKSSLVKAGLMPLLAGHVAPVYVEATASETEAGLLRGLRKEFPELPDESGLVEAIAILRRNSAVSMGRKALLVLDQFEQWLFAHGREEGTELVAALRQCDGEHVLALCLVRDDFWMAATRFMKDLEVDLVPHRNVAAVDLFDLKHARKVLAAFGRAYESLPAEGCNLSKEQNGFLDQAIAGLSEDARVVPVRLALFAEMVKAKPWMPETLKDVGGMDGVGVRFLEETFGSARSNPEHRYHQKAAQAVLQSLLPETNSDIKGRMRSSEELCVASGYGERPGDFGNLIRILDSDLRLITPVDPAGERMNDEGGRGAEAGQGQAAGGHESTSSPEAHPEPLAFYQLTHDYLVHSLRDWLTRKQKATRRGRAELLLAERSALWNAKPENHHLPSVREWAILRSLLPRASWSEPERRMMSRSDRKALIRTLTTAAVLGSLLVVAALVRRSVKEAYDRNHSRQLVLRLQSALIDKVPQAIAEMRDHRLYTDPELYSLLKESADKPDQKLRASLALLPVDPGQVQYLAGRLTDASPGELSVLCESLKGHEETVSGRLWAKLLANGPDGARVLGPAGALARFDPASPRWSGIAGKTARAMVAVNPIHVTEWLAIFRPVKDRLRGELKATLRDARSDETDRVHAMTYLVDYASEDPSELVDLLEAAGAKEFALVFPEVDRRRAQAIAILERAVTEDGALPGRDEDEKDRRAVRQAKAAVALFRLNAREHVWRLLEHRADPRIRSFLIHWLTRLGEDPGTSQACLGAITKASKRPERSGNADPNRSILFDRELSIQRALLLVVGHFDPGHLAADDRERAMGKLFELYRDHPDAGIHGAARWALWRIGQGKKLREIDTELSQREENGERRWYVNAAGQTMVKIDGPVQFQMGEPSNDPEYQSEIQHARTIPRRFAIAATEVSIGEFAEFWKRHSGEFPGAQFGQAAQDRPRGLVTWYMAAAYCNWLSEKEKRTPVYEKNAMGQYAEKMRLTARAFDGGGYRLPTEAEWEYACRAGTLSSRYFGHSWDLLRAYARLTSWEEVSTIPGGSLLPNDFGLFDMLGNVAEWCHDGDYYYEDFVKGMPSDFQFTELIDSHYRVLRGASCINRPPDARSAARFRYEPGEAYFSNGFRLARTLP